MVNGLGVLAWGVGGIEAEAVMLGQPCYILVPEVVGVKLNGTLPEGTTATDLVLAITEKLRSTGVVEKFVEFFGPGLSSLPVADRATIANMAPEYGATCGFFPVDEQTINYEFTVDDPTTYTSAWSGEVPFKALDELVYEYACHEANYSLFNVLSGARAEEREAAKKKEEER